jgi:excisionase family DNA binding protein
MGAGLAGMVSQAFSNAQQQGQNAPQQAAGQGAAAAPDVMNLTEAASYLRVSEADVQGLIDGGQVKAKKIGSEYRIARKSLDDFLAA